MSFILDALKKSELERQRQSVPGLVESGPLRRRARLPAWAIALGVLLAVNLIVLAVVLVRSSPGSSRPVEAGPEAHRPAAAAADDAAAGNSGPFSPLDSAPVYAPEIPVAAAPEAPAPVAVRPQSGGSDVAAVKPAAHRRDPVLNEDDYKAKDDEVLPTVNELNLSGAEALPDLHLDVHVYATNSAERFVYINMRKYHEGATLQEGPTLERIRRDGVILDYRGLRFLLPRQ
jgi:general secretion pathway protein B